MFFRDVYLTHNGMFLNCGKTMDNLKAPLYNEIDCIDKINMDFKDKTIIDVGANIGTFTIAFAKRVGDNGKVIAIEPTEETFRLLKENCAYNCGNNTALINIGCYNKKGMMTFFENYEYPTGNTFYIEESDYIKSEEMKPTKVAVDTIDNICEFEKSVDLIKIDVEGCELQVLEGAVETIQKHNPKILFEAWEDEDARKINLFLAKYGYYVKHLGGYNYLAENY